MSENLITGPGWYPKRPSGRGVTTVCEFEAPVHDVVYRVKLTGIMMSSKTLCWRGSGRYTYTHPAGAAAFTALGWQVSSSDGHRLFSVNLPSPGIYMTAGTSLTIPLRCDGARPYTDQAVTVAGWKFEAL